MRYLFMLISLLQFGTAFGQKDTVEYYFDYQWKPCKPVSGCYYRRTYKEGDLWRVKDYYLSTRTLQMDGTSLDDSGNIDHGMFYFYHENGRLSEKGRFVRDTIEGLVKKYDTSGRLIDSALYKKGLPWKFWYQWYSNGTLKYKGVFDDSGYGKGEAWFYWEDGKPADHAYLSAGNKLDSVLTHYNQSGIICCKDYYKNGERIRRECYGPNGLLLQGSCEDRGSDWAGSRREFRKKMQSMKDRLRYTASDEVKALIKKLNGDMVIRMCVNEEGTVSASLIKGLDPLVDKFIMDILSDWPKVKPAIINNRPQEECAEEAIPIRSAF